MKHPRASLDCARKKPSVLFPWVILLKTLLNRMLLNHAYLSQSLAQLDTLGLRMSFKSLWS